MTLAGQEIQRNLRRLASRWGGYTGSERAEAQTFLTELLACYGTDRHDAGVRFEHDQPRPGGGHGYVDALWPGRCLVEMKAPAEAGRLHSHREQALDYWRHSSDPATDRPAVDYVVLCAFTELEVWQPGRFPLAPRAAVSLSQLPDRYEALLFLAGQRPLFLDADRSLTTEAAKRTVELYGSLAAREAGPPEQLMSFILQTTWCAFASSIGLLGGHPLRVIAQSLLADDDGQRSSAAELGHLFEVLARDDLMNQGGVYASAVYVNGGLFQAPARVHLRRGELEALADVAAFDWSQVEPTIFGSLLEGFLPRDRAIAEAGQRTQFGVHYTHEADILKIVQPSIVEPWLGRIEAAATVPEAVDVLGGLCRLRVLDPACGSGNFLYVAYRELRDLEARARERIGELASSSGVRPPDPTSLPSFPLANLFGIEIDPFAVRVTRLVLWMGHKLAADKHGTPEPPLPLPDLDAQVLHTDALRTPWPAADVIVGNPPFNGSQHLRRAVGDDYIAWLQREFGSVRDYCTYWFRLAADRLPAGGRAGLVGTNSVAQGRGREASLDHVVDAGGVITDAVSSQPWPGEANVHVSLVNWVQRPTVPPARFVLNGQEVPGGIAADLVPLALSTIGAQPLHGNVGLCFQGVIRTGDGFLLDEHEALQLRRRTDADYTAVVRRFMDGEDLTENPLQEPSRWVIDFGVRSLEESAGWPEALAIVRRRVKPERDAASNPGNRRYWWRFERPRPALRAALVGLSRFIAVGSTGKRTLTAWCDVDWCPGNLVYAVALQDDWSMGVLMSAAHLTWATCRGSTLENRLRYTPTTVFATFPWPDASAEQRERIGAAARRVVEERARACAGERGLTAVYNLVDDGGFTALAAAHRELDLAVATAYGWPASVVADPYEVIPRLMALNRDIAEGRHPYDPFPGRGATAGEDRALFSLSADG